MNTSTKFITRTALFVSLGIIFPIVFHQFGLAGRIFLPMHIPVLLAGAICGPLSGVFVGVICPGLSFLLTGMPPTYAVPLMTIELILYGLASGVFYKRFKMNMYVALVLSLIAGRIGFALGLLVFGLFLNLPYGIAEYFGGAVVTGIPGIIVQIVIIPPIIMVIRKWEKN